ncbi:cAMP-dependent protein kinase inhibitor beta [Acipenser oxyrinchus oxyrinchus]|uniref:cAMP-dependent protein kinase inhibitor beta n=1 Tax=Acipenser oxyrinchus oxyrinchus TaxID=40147 RepID=A0AAD8GC47_ACIOX|nr:cAMP-dependent protein kinase inhibitor beta [Acipenser oxyrinchus oxyrinchus]
MTDVVIDFEATGRTGRRNALPDILGSPAGVGMSELPQKLAELSMSDEGAQGGETSSSDEADPNPSETEEKSDET